MLIDIITQSRSSFFYFIEVCNQQYRFGHDLNSYREIIDMHKESQNIVDLVRNDMFCEKVYRTLEAWNMNQRGARLQEFGIIKKSLRQHEPYLVDLYRNSLACMNSLGDGNGEKVIRDLEFAFCHLDVMKSKRRIVGVSKTLHFLLPHLVMPIDSTYTMLYFYGSNRYYDKAEKEFQTFLDVFTKIHRITKQLELTTRDVDGEKWNTSIPKLIDNAIIGFDKYMKGHTSG